MCKNIGNKVILRTWNIQHGIRKRISPWISHSVNINTVRNYTRIDMHECTQLTDCKAQHFISILPWTYKPSVRTGVHRSIGHRSHIGSNHWTEKALFAVQITLFTIFSEPPKWWMAEMRIWIHIKTFLLIKINRDGFYISYWLQKYWQNTCWLFRFIFDCLLFIFYFWYCSSCVVREEKGFCFLNNLVSGMYLYRLLQMDIQ